MTSRALWQAHSSVFHRFIKPLPSFINTKFLEDPFLDVNGAAALALPLTCPRPRPAPASGSCTSPPPPLLLPPSAAPVGQWAAPAPRTTADGGRTWAGLGTWRRSAGEWALGGPLPSGAVAGRRPLAADRVAAVPWRRVAARARCGQMTMRSTNWDSGTGDQIWAFTGLD